MTRYTVVWHLLAQVKLAQIWLAASDRTTIADAANAIDRELAADPETKGIRIDVDIYERTQLPIRVLYQVSEPDRLVKVAGVKLA